MLQHEEQTASQTSASTSGSESAANVRVTAEEFARAVTRYQARREQAAQRMEGTVAIGDAVQELGLEATPEEILAEVQAERAAQEGLAAQKADVSYHRRPRFVSLGIAVAATFALLSFGVLAPRAIVSPSGPATLNAPQAQTSPPQMALTADPAILVKGRSDGKSILEMLSEVPDNVPIQCDLEVVASQSTLRSQFTGYTSGSGSNWTLIKHTNHIYVRGWIANTSLPAVRTKGVTLFSQKTDVSSDAPPIPVTLSLDRFKINISFSSDNTIVAEQVQPDGHFSEKW